MTLWRFKDARQETATVRVNPATSSNNGAVIHDWALAGLGIVIRSEWNVADDLAAGRLRRILPDWEIPPADVVAMLAPATGEATERPLSWRCSGKR